MVGGGDDFLLELASAQRLGSSFPIAICRVLWHTRFSRRGLFAALIAALLITPAVQAQVVKMSGSDVLASHEGYPVWTSGFVFGLAAGARNLGICPFVGLSQSQFEAMPKKCLAENPERLHLTIADLVDETLIKAWSCRRQ